MTTDEQALLAAIAATPADDTARLVYADWLDEHDRPARAAFIRTQVEAEGLHRHSPRRAELERRADALLADHWIDWWTPVCEAAGLRVPARRRATRFGRVAQALHVATPTGEPYKPHGLTVYRSPDSHVNPNPLDGFESVEFRRGFPEAVECVFHAPDDGAFLSRWPVSPLSRVKFHGLRAGCWREVPRLVGVSAVELHDYDPDGFADFLASRILPGLEGLTLGDPAAGHDTALPELVALSESRFAPLLRRLSVAVWDEDSVGALARGFGGLTALTVDLEPEAGVTPPAFVIDRLMTLARSARLATLVELTLSGGFTPDELHRAVAISRWKELRTLSLDFHYAEVHQVTLPAAADLPALEDLSVTGLTWTPEALAVLVASPLVKQLRHFTIDLWQADALSGDDWRRLADAVDPQRIETFRINPDHNVPGLHLLRQRLGDKLRTPW